MKHYYISNPEAEKGFEEITEEEWNNLIGEEPYRTYATKLYRGSITIDEVPEDYKENVQNIVNNKISKWGLYSERNITSSELQDMIEEVL